MYFEKTRSGPVDNNRYLAQNDTSVLSSSDLRKTRLTLRMINDARRASEAHEKEKKEELGLIRQMYAAPPAEAAV